MALSRFAASEGWVDTSEQGIDCELLIDLVK
jgi:hypothetical protein